MDPRRAPQTIIMVPAIQHITPSKIAEVHIPNNNNLMIAIIIIGSTTPAIVVMDNGVATPTTIKKCNKQNFNILADKTTFLIYSLNNY